MAELFDPYYKWLGISPQNQPPDLYRLLALERFENDLEVIEAAANRQMIYIQGCATGPYVEHSQKLLNEISAARLCLLDARRKTEYDAVLREKMTGLRDKLTGGVNAASPAAAPLRAGAPVGREATGGNESDSAVVTRSSRPAVPPPAPARPKAGSPLGTIAIRDETSSRVGRRAPRKKGQPIAAILLLGLLAAIVVGVAAYLLLVPEKDKSGTLAGTLGSRANATPNATVSPVRDGGSAASDVAPKGGAEPGEIVAPGSTPQPELPPVPPQDANAVAAEVLFREANEALSRRDLSAAEEKLTKVLTGPPSAITAQAQPLYNQLKTATSNDWGRQELTRLDNDSLVAFSQGRMQFQFPGWHPALISVAQETLSRVLPEIMKSRGLSPSPTAPAPPPQQPPAPPAGQSPPAAEPADPADVLKAKGLKRVWRTWILHDEARCLELMEAAKKSGKPTAEVITEARRLAATLDEQYRKLAADPAVKDALQQLEQQLGPSEEFNALRGELNRGK